MAGGHYSTGGAFLLYPSFRPHSTAQIRVDTEAGVTLYIGATAIGQGAMTVLCQMVAEELGVDYREVHLVCQDTMLAPMDNGTYDSRLTYGSGHAIKNAAADIKAKLFEVAPSWWAPARIISSASTAKSARSMNRTGRSRSGRPSTST